VNADGKREQQSSAPEAAVEDSNGGCKNCGGRQGAGMKVLIGEVDGDSRQRKCE
jgi:hypothetical protein